jgi:hypothetical protein
VKQHFQIAYREQGAPPERTQRIKVTSWAQVGGHIGNLAEDCDTILVYCNGKIVLRYDNDGVQ